MEAHVYSPFKIDSWKGKLTLFQFYTALILRKFDRELIEFKYRTFCFKIYSFFHLWKGMMIDEIYLKISFVFIIFRIFNVMGFPLDKDWEDMRKMPEHPTLVKVTFKGIVYLCKNTPSRSAFSFQLPYLARHSL